MLTTRHNVIPHLQPQIRSLGAVWVKGLQVELQSLIKVQGAPIMKMAVRW